MKPSGIHLSFLICAFFPFFACSEPEPQLPQQPLSEIYDQAMGLVARSELDSAQTLFGHIVQKDSSQYTALLGLAEIHMRKRRVKKAIPYLQRALRADTTRVDAPFQLAQAYRIIGRDDRARPLLKLIVARFPTFTPACMAYADVLMTDAPPSPEGALEQYETILSIDPQMTKARAGAGASRLRLGQFKQAERDFTELLEATPNDPYIAYLLATTRHWQKDYSGAVSAYKKSIDVLPQSSPQRRIRQWNLRLAYIAAGGEYPGDLDEHYVIFPGQQPHPSPVKFTDVAALKGVDKTDRSRGVSWVDLNGDGLLDLFTVGIDTPHGLFLQSGQSFQSPSDRSTLDQIPGGWAAIAADYDGDGDSDLYVTRNAWEGGGPNSLYQNDGKGHFVDRATTSDVVDPDDSFTAAWGDINGDGWLDLYVADGVTGSGAANKLFVAKTNGTFQNHAPVLGVADKAKSLGVAFGDYDLDGDLDLYVANVANPNRLYRNDGSHFTDIGIAAGVSAPKNGSYVPFFFDSDSDGDLDIFVSAMAYYEDYVESATMNETAARSRAHLYRNEGNDQFVERAVPAGLGRAFGSMGAGYGDVDGDGQIDIYLANGGPIMPRFEPDALFLRTGDTYVEVAERAGVANQGKGHGVAFADYDQDGDLDLYVGLGGHYPGDVWPNSLYQNRGIAGKMVTITLNGAEPNPSAIGGQVVLYSDDHVQRSEVQSGGGFGSTSSYPLEFGLGMRTLIDSLHITWPTGKVDKYNRLPIGQPLEFNQAQ